MKLIYVLMLAPFLISNVALAGDGAHGGTGLQCPSLKISFQLFDFFQISEPGRYSDSGIEVPRVRDSKLTVEEDVQRQIEIAFKKLEKVDIELALEARDQLKRVHIVPTSTGETLPVLDIDNEELARIPTECRDGLVGIMLWYDTEKNPNDDLLKVDFERLHTLPVTDQAGTWVHEAVTPLKTIEILQIRQTIPTKTWLLPEQCCFRRPGTQWNSVFFSS